jgi:peptide/nickel transport system substrate-binding protein
VKKWNKWLATTTILTLAVGTVAGCGSNSNSGSDSASDANAKPVDGGSVTLQLPSTPDNDFNPIVGNNQYTQFAAYNFVHEMLFQEQPDGTFAPNLAKSYDISPDKKTVTIHLREDAKWSDGQPITADDVAFTYNVIATKEYTEVLQGPQDVSQFQGYDVLHNKNSYDDVAAGKLSMSGVKVIDQHTVAVTLKDALANALTQVNQYVIPKHIWAKIPVNQWKVAEQDVKNDVSSGPFKLTDYKAKEYYTLEKNDNFFGNKPHLDKIIWKVVPADTAAGQLKNGQLDMVMWVKPADLKLYETLSNVNKIETPNWGYQYLGFKLNNKYLKDKALRQAIAYSIDRDSIIKALFQGHASKTEVPVPRGFYYPKDGEIPTYNYDPEKAKQILKDAGYKLGPDGKWLDKDGQPMKLTLSYPKGNPTREQAAPMYVDYMKKIGLDVTLNPPTDFATLIERVQKDDPSVQMWLMGGGFTRLDPDQTGAWGANDPANLTRWNNKQNEELVAEAISPKASDPNVRRDIMIKWEKLYKEELPELEMYTENSIYFYNKRLHGVKNYQNVYDIYYHPEDWWVSK